MAVLEETLEDKKDMSRVIVPRQALQDLRVLAAKEGQILVKRLEKQLLFIGQDMTIAASLLDVVFPDYKAILATKHRNIISVNREAFLKGLKKVMTIASDDPVKLTARAEELVLYVEAEIGRAKETVSATSTGEGEISAHFQAKFLADLFSRIPDDTVLIEAPEQYGHFFFKGVNSPGYVTVLMPIRM